MDGFELRLSRPEDAHDLRETCWPDRSERAVKMRLSDMSLRQERGVAWGLVAVVEGQTAAYGQLARWLQGGEISDVIVSEPLRGQGIGRALVTRLVDLAREKGLPEVEIGAAEANTRALALYRSLGFVDRRRMTLDLGDGPEPVIYLYLSFDAGKPLSA